jgi:hypothetical protein
MYTGENPRKRGSNNMMRTRSGDEEDDNKEKLGQRFY